MTVKKFGAIITSYTNKTEFEMSKMNAVAALYFYWKCLIVWTVSMMALILVGAVLGQL